MSCPFCRHVQRKQVRTLQSSHRNDASRPRIYLDGYNLALEQGTGVATYARNLSFALRDLGAEVGVLYGTRVPKASRNHMTSRNQLIREIAFFDPAVGQPHTIVRWIRW